MAKKIFKIVKGAATGLFVGGPAGAVGGAALGLASALKKKKKTEPAAPAATATKGPKVTPLGQSGLPLTRQNGTMIGLSDRLGG